jgi:soluble lytic murein transglycosylase
MRIHSTLSTNIVKIIVLTCSLTLHHITFADYINDAMRQAGKSHWQEALSIAKTHKDSVLHKIILSRQFLDSADKTSSFEQVISFIAMNPLWPTITQITKHAEYRIHSSTNKDLIVKWFSEHRPKTPNGYKYYALSAKGRVKDPEILDRIIREGWIYGNFSVEEERAFLSRNKDTIKPIDNIRKLDILLWDDNRFMAHKTASLLGSKAKMYVEAFLAFVDNKPNKNALFSKLPNEYKHNSGILYQYISQFKKSDEISVRDATLLLHVPKDNLHGAEWWRIQNLVARNLIKHKHYELAYKITASHQCDCSKDINESEWLAGWISLKFLHNYQAAYNHFEKVYNVVQYSISTARAAYWLGETAKVMHNTKLAHKWFLEAGVYNFTFYGQLAILAMNKDAITLPPAPKITASDQAFYKKNEFVRAVNIWLKEGNIEKALVYTKSAIAHAKNSGEVALIVNAIKNHKSLYYTTEAAKSAAHHGYFISHDHNPTPYKFKKGPVEPSLSYAIMLRESVFDQRAISHANAHGLMQVVPATACILAKKLKMHCSTKSLTHDPVYNITLGNKYLEELLERYNGSYLLAIASYNAGPHVIDKWILQMGDPRKFKNYHQVVNWIESIPYYETREYVQRVIENLEVYRSVLGASRTLLLKKDLLRGK